MSVLADVRCAQWCTAGVLLKCLRCAQKCTGWCEACTWLYCWCVIEFLRCAHVLVYCVGCQQEAVAVKCIAKSKLVSEPTEFLREIENLSTVDHAHIVQLFGVASSNDSFMLVTSSL